MKISASETDRINRKLAGKREVTYIAFDYKKTFKMVGGTNDNGGMFFNSLAEAKKCAVDFKSHNPEMTVRVIEMKKKVHEFHIKGEVPI